MNFWKRCGAAMLAAMALALPGAAFATKYVGTVQIGSILAKYSVVTDGATGVLTGSDIVSFTVRLDAGAGKYISYGMGPGMEYPGYAMSDGFVATPSELLAGDPFRYFVLNAAAYEPYDSNTLAGFSADQRGGALFLQASFYDPRNGYVSHHSQLSTPGLAFAHAVPEPATWAMMIVGFGMIGGAIRHRKRRPAFSAPRFV